MAANQSLLTMYGEIFVDRLYETTLPDAPSILDCGANIGLSTIWFKLRYPDATITLFEADPELVRVLRENLETLALEGVEVVPAAVSATSGSVAFTRASPLSGRITADLGLSVDSVRLRDMIEHHVDLLKLDVEGSEFDVIDDLCTSGRVAEVENIVCEIHGNSLLQGRVAALVDSLHDAGFRSTMSELRFWVVGPGPEDPTPFPSVESGKFLLHLYAWRELGGRSGRA